MNVYDFDETIYDGESVLDFFFYYLKKMPWLAKHLPRVIWLFGRYKLGKVTTDELLGDYSEIVEDFINGREDIIGDALDFWNRHEKKIKPFYDELHRDDDVIITASPEFSTKIICSRLGIKSCIGSKIDLDNGKIESLCMRSHKIPAFLEAYPNAEIDNFYTDSPVNDAPLIDMAKHAFVVRGNKIKQIK